MLKELCQRYQVCNVPIVRRTADNTVNNYGQQLIDLLKNNLLYFLNGRIGPDFENSKSTCRNVSTVDYFVSSSAVFKHVTDFCVHDFCDLYSDVHCPISLTLKSKFNKNTIRQYSEKLSSIKIWDPDKKDLFIENFDVLRMVEIETKLDRIIEDRFFTQSAIDSIVTDIGNLFAENSKGTFGMVLRTNHKPKHNKNRAWFNKDCHRMRNIYHKTRKLYNKYKTEYNKERLKEISKQYKETLRISNKNFNLNRINKLRNLKHADPRQYWKIINTDSSKSTYSANLDDFYTFFKNVNETQVNVTDTEDLNLNNMENEEINKEISEQEIFKAANALKNNKSPGCDNIVNEQIKATLHYMLPIYKKLFNIIFDEGIVPECWTVGIIKPIYKNKGDPKLPENYRPISLLSCFGKLFTSILNNRLTTWAEQADIISQNQSGFRKNHSTVDNLFILKSLIDIVHFDKKKLFCCFVDFKQCFDSIWRIGLWKKLLNENINGKCFNIIKSMYNNIKSKIQTSEGSTPFFNCVNGVRQGENLSPFLFSIYLNDLEDYLRNRNFKGIEKHENVDNARMYLKLLILLYADDTVIFSDNDIDMQNALNSFKDYCDIWKLTVNVDKTKIIIFSKGRISQNRIFKLGTENIETINEYKYLGIYFSRTGSFTKTKKYLAEQANKAMFSLLRKINNLSLPYDIQIDLFEKTIKPILLYGCEIWGFGNIDILERVQLKFYKYIFGLKKSTPTHMIYGELGVLPINIEVKKRVISYWTKIADNSEDNNTKLSHYVYEFIYNHHMKNKVKSEWINNVKTILCSHGYSGVWYSQSFLNKKWLTNSIHRKLQDNFIQSWMSEINRTSNTLYKTYKSEFKQSKYILVLPSYLSKSMMAFFTRNHHLPIELGRWRGIPYNERKCNYCGNLGDEFHYILQCNHFNNLRKKYVKPFYYRRPNTQKLKDLLNTENRFELKKLSFFLDIIRKTINS